MVWYGMVRIRQRRCAGDWTQRPPGKEYKQRQGEDGAPRGEGPEHTGSRAQRYPATGRWQMPIMRGSCMDPMS